VSYPRQQLAAIGLVVASAAGIGLLLGRDVRVAGAGMVLEITGPPEIDVDSGGASTRTETGWLVEGPATIRATRAGGTIREVRVPSGQTRRVVLREEQDGMTLEIAPR